MCETRCGLCRHYIELSVPYRYDKVGYPDGVTVYGFCAKNAQRTGSFYPVYLPDGGVCRDFLGAVKRKKPCDCAEQLEIGESL